MRSVWKPPLFRQGFTLIEVVITIVIAAILGSLVLSYLGTSLTKSGYSVRDVQNEGFAEACMERIISDYVKGLNSAIDPASVLAVLETLRTHDYTAVLPASGTLTRSYVTYDATTGAEIAAGGPTTNLKVTVQVGDAKLTSLLTAQRSSGSDPYVVY